MIACRDSNDVCLWFLTLPTLECERKHKQRKSPVPVPSLWRLLCFCNNDSFHFHTNTTKLSNECFSLLPRHTWGGTMCNVTMIILLFYLCFSFYILWNFFTYLNRVNKFKSVMIVPTGPSFPPMCWPSLFLPFLRFLLIFTMTCFQSILQSRV